MKTIGERPWTAEVVGVHGSPGELDEISLDVIVNFTTGARRYDRVRPLNYRRKSYTCVGATPGDVCFIVWRGDAVEFVAPYDPEFEECGGGSGSSGSIFGSDGTRTSPGGRPTPPLSFPGDSKTSVGDGGGTS